MAENDMYPQGQTLRVLIIVAHPDDAEFMAGGALAKWTREGHEVSYCVITDGNVGSSDPAYTRETLAETRIAEQTAAAQTIGAKHIDFLHYVDSELEPNLQVRRDVTRVIRARKPNIVVTNDPTMRYTGTYINHPDHRAAGEIALTAVMPSADTRLIFPELLDEGYEPHKVSHIYLMATANPDHWLPLTEADITTQIAALRKHASQVGVNWEPEKRIHDNANRAAEDARKNGQDAGEFATGFKLIKLREIPVEAVQAEQNVDSD